MNRSLSHLRKYGLPRIQGWLLRRGLSVHRARNEVALAIRSVGIDAVIDGGANVGQFAASLRRSGYNGRIISYEPSNAAFTELSARTLRDPAWTAVQALLGAESGSLNLHVSDDLVSSSVLPRSATLMSTFPRSGPQTASPEIALVTTVDELIRDNGLNPSRTALKLDVQGFEGSVLDGSAESLGRLPLVILEMCFVELYEGQALWPQLYERMTAAGYSLWNLIPGWVDRPSGRLCWCDGVFVRADLADLAAHLGHT